MGMPGDEVLSRIYGEEAPAARRRYEALAHGFAEAFPEAATPDGLRFYSAPGRTEIIGNHTDHNGGKVLAASITQDSICSAAPTGDRIVTIVSEGYPEPFRVDLDRLDEVSHEGGTTALVAGIMDGLAAGGRKLGGLDAYVTTQVIPSAGVSSSASFEMLVGTVVSDLFNDGVIPIDELARAGQHAENAFWGKASGLLDQMACGVGGTVLLDFADGVRCERAAFGYDDLGYDLVIVNTGKGHADLSAEYSAIPDEMHAVARALGVSQLCQTSEEALLADLPRVREEVGSDRAILRSLHFFEECARVDEAASALAAGDEAHVLGLIAASGSSSWRLLQNVAVPGVVEEQPVALALALTEAYLAKVGAGVCRVHGGGFAGVIMVALPKAETAGYCAYMTRYVGEGNVYPMGIRQTGAVRVA